MRQDISLPKNLSGRTRRGLTLSVSFWNLMHMLNVTLGHWYWTFVLILPWYRKKRVHYISISHKYKLSSIGSWDEGKTSHIQERPVWKLSFLGRIKQQLHDLNLHCSAPHAPRRCRLKSHRSRTHFLMCTYSQNFFSSAACFFKFVPETRVTASSAVMMQQHPS